MESTRPCPDTAMSSFNLPCLPRPRPRRSRNAHKEESSRSTGKRSSIYRGVTRHRWTGRYEAHLWDKNSWNSIQNKKGRQVYLGAYDDEAAAAHTYDLAALKYWGADTALNFPLSSYVKEFEEMQGMTKEEYLAALRRRSSGFSRGVSKYRGVARHHHNGRWEARIGRVHGNKYLYLGTFSTQEEAAQAYDLAALEFRGPNAVTNFDVSCYIGHHPLQQPPSPMPTSMPPQAETSAIGYDSKLEFTDATCDFSWSGAMGQCLSSLRETAMGQHDDLPDLFECVGFEGDVEQLFEGIEAGKLGADAESGGSSRYDGGVGGIMAMDGAGSECV